VAHFSLGPFNGVGLEKGKKILEEIKVMNPSGGLAKQNFRMSLKPYFSW
jgi:hypothetical protein